MSGLLMRERLKALGYDVDALPVLATCLECGGEDGPPEMSFDVMEGDWHVWCGCGASSHKHPTLIAAMREWNELNADGDEVPLGVEAGVVHE